MPIPSPSGERIIYKAKPHWIYLAKPIFLTLIGLVCTVCTLVLGTTKPPPGQPSLPNNTIEVFVTCSACIFAVALLGTIIVTLNYINSNFTLTSRRVIKERGGLKHRSLEIYLKQVDSVFVETSFLGKLLGYGTIVIMSGAVKESLISVANPQEIRRCIQEQIAQL